MNTLNLLTNLIYEIYIFHFSCLIVNIFALANKYLLINIKKNTFECDDNIHKSKKYKKTLAANIYIFKYKCNIIFVINNVLLSIHLFINEWFCIL